jgi:hypothetical protein
VDELRGVSSRQVALEQKLAALLEETRLLSERAHARTHMR